MKSCAENTTIENKSNGEPRDLLIGFGDKLGFGRHKEFPWGEIYLEEAFSPSVGL